MGENTMATSIGNSPSSLVEILEQYPEKYSFYQTIRLLERFTQNKLDSSTALRVKPVLTLKQPLADIESVQVKPETNTAEVVTNFLGLYGVSTPLPTWYTETLSDAELEDKDSAKTLLDVLHQRIYSLFYQALKKYSLLHQIVEEQSEKYTLRLFDLLGEKKATINTKTSTPHLLLRYLSLFRQRPRSAEGLRVILEDILKDVKVEILQCIEQEIKIPEFQRLVPGETGHCLGENTVLGEQTLDCNGKMVIAIGPVSFDRFYQLLNGSEESRVLMYLIEAYIDIPLDISLEIVLAENEANFIQLGDPKTSCLGKNAWVLSGDVAGILKARMPLNFANDFFQ
jgi:type VI secretion system protein ImpH